MAIKHAADRLHCRNEPTRYVVIRLRDPAGARLRRIERLRQAGPVVTETMQFVLEVGHAVGMVQPAIDRAFHAPEHLLHAPQRILEN